LYKLFKKRLQIVLFDRIYCRLFERAPGGFCIVDPTNFTLNKEHFRYVWANNFEDGHDPDDHGRNPKYPKYRYVR